MDASDTTGTDPPAERSAGSWIVSFFGWYHHAVAFAYAGTATVSSWSGSLRNAAFLFVASLLLAYAVVAAVTVAVRLFDPSWLS
ncbi:hypothetical protein [Haloplanus sp.]|uniref:hypothetical protein n=1 Tax=Haloplanus sp. TaxID=1961696 RepID=UPI0026155091|nr:hypothetical protein [Haloplanus sp.]